MFEMDNYKGLQFFKKEDLVDTDVLLQMGYVMSEVTDFRNASHCTTYFYHPDKAYAFILSAWNLNEEDEFYTQIIISRDILDKMGYPHSILLSSEKSTHKAVIRVGDKKQFLKAFLPKRARNIVTSYTTLNIIDSQTTRYFSKELEQEGIIFPNSPQHEISVLKDIENKTFILKITDKVPAKSDVLESLREKGFCIRYTGADYITLTKSFKKELMAWKAAYDYEMEYYQELQFNPFTDYISKDFDLAYMILILEELSVIDAMKKAMYDWRMDWFKIVKYNLEALYDLYRIPYLGVLSDANGSMIPDESNREEVETFEMTEENDKF